MASLVNKDEKGGKTMRAFCRKVKVFFKSGIESVIAFCKKNKKTIIRLVGKLVKKRDYYTKNVIKNSKVILHLSMICSIKLHKNPNQNYIF